MALFPGRDLRPVAAILISVAIAGVGFGASLPLLSILLERAGTSGTLIGASTAMTAGAALIVTPFVPGWLSRFGAARVLMAALLTIALTLFVMRAHVDVWFWFPVRLLFGAGLAVMFAASEYWVNAMAPEASRGRIVGLYATIFSAGWAVGPLLLRVLDPATWQPFIAMGLLLALAMVPLALAGNAAPAPSESRRHSFWAITRAAPAATLAAFVYGGVELGIFALLPVYVERAGYDAGRWTLMLMALALGNVVLQYPIGWLADRMDRTRLLLFCALAGLAGAVSLPFVLTLPWLLYPSLFLWGGVVVGLYTMGLVLLGERFKGGDLAASNAVFVMLYSLGGLVTPPVSGLAMDLWEPHGLVLVLGLLCAAYTLIVARPRSKARPA